MNRMTMGLAATAVVVLAAVAGWFRPIAKEAKTVAAADNPWRVPDASALERSSIEQFAAIRGVRWLGDGGAGAVGTSSAQWTLRGVVGPLHAAALVQVGQDPLIKRFEPGDTLPDGSHLDAVERNGIVIDRDGCRLRLPLYVRAKDKTSAPDADCLATGTTKETHQP